MDQIRPESDGHVILCSNPQAQYLAHKDDIDAAITRVKDSGFYVLGSEVKNFEKEFSDYCGTAHAIGVNSGTDALTLSLKAFGIGPGDEVITVSHTALATIAAILAAGATPVLIDIDPQTYTIDPGLIAAAYTNKTKAIIPVHLYGQPADMDAIMSFAKDKGLKVIEDCAQATGATYKDKRVGSIGDAGCFSFYPTKNLGCLGDGGMIISNDETFAKRVARLRQYGWDHERATTEPGVNSRLDEIQAAILRVKLPLLDADNDQRRKIASRYTDGLGEAGFVLPHTAGSRDHVYHLYVAQTDKRDAFLIHLRDMDIGAAIHYPVPAHLEQGYQDKIRVAKSLAVTEKLVPRILSLPIYPELADHQVETVIKACMDFK